MISEKFSWKHFWGNLNFVCLVITLSIAFVILFTPLYRWTLNFHNIPSQVGMSADQIMANYYVLLEYLHSPFINELNFPDFSSSASGLFHFYEVKILFYLNYAILITSTICSYFYTRFLNQTGTWHKLVRPFFIMIFLPFILLLVLVLNFDTMFVQFHKILFNNDAWLFKPSTDPIITVLPQEFFMYCFALAFILIVLSIALIYLMAKRKTFKSPSGN